jgi:hypothetical protein
MVPPQRRRDKSLSPNYPGEINTWTNGTCYVSTKDPNQVYATSPDPGNPVAGAVIILTQQGGPEGGKQGCLEDIPLGGRPIDGVAVDWNCNQSDPSPSEAWKEFQLLTSDGQTVRTGHQTARRVTNGT